MSTRREIEVVIAIQFGLNHTSNTCMIKNYHKKECKEFNVTFETLSKITKSHETPTVALFDEKGTIQAYGVEAELQHMKLADTCNHLLFREFIWDLFCSDEKVS